MATRLQVRVGDTARAVVIGPGGDVSVDGTGLAVTSLGRGLYRVTDGHTHHTVAVAGPPEARWVSVDGQVAVLEVAPEGQSRRRAKGADVPMMAPMPANVVKVLVEPGATVKAGDTVLVLEAMKMELPVKSPRDGVVAAVHCRAGELVPPNVPLVELA
jgi:biotin carboxyl carrier protein